jgi:predicted nucleic acid-binding protein
MGGVDPVKSVFVDTSGFYAFLDRDDRFHTEAKRLFLKSEAGEWALVTSSYVLHESWALIQARLGWDAVEDFLRELVVRCRIVWVDERFHQLGAARARQARERRLSLTDCVSFEVMLAEGCLEYLGDDEHFKTAGFHAAQ